MTSSSTKKVKRTARPFDQRSAEAELGRLKRRARRLEGRIASQLEQEIQAAFAALYRAKNFAAAAADVRALLEERP